MVGGLVANASIFMVNDVIRSQRRRGGNKNGNKNRTMINAVFVRNRTILLIMLATCCGLIPYLLDGTREVFWFSFAIGTIGGLLFSLVSLFFFLPVLLWTKNS
jgi:multidrug efflux pump subunit AcrB